MEVAHHLLTSHQFEYVLTSKFQTDVLESRFGQNRQVCGGNRLVLCKMCGGNRLVSVQDVWWQ